MRVGELARWAALVGALGTLWGCGDGSVNEAVGGGNGKGGGGSGAEGGGGTAVATTSTEESTTTSSGEDFCSEGTPVSEKGPGGNACPCEASPGIHVTDGCGAYFLQKAYRVESNCDMAQPFAMATECKATSFTLQVLACNGGSMSPCLKMGVGTNPQGDSSWGEWIDANGDVWALTDVQMPGALPWDGPNAKGTFTATATREDGVTQQISGDYDVCIADAPVCPI